MQLSFFHGLRTAALAAGGVVVVFCYLSRRSRNCPPQAKSWLPFIGNALEYSRNYRAFLAKNRAKHGNLFSANFFGVTIHFLHDIEVAHSTIMAQPRLFDAGPLLFRAAHNVFQLPFAAQSHGIFVRWTHAFFSGNRLRTTASSLSRRVQEHLKHTTSGKTEHDARDLIESMVWSCTIRVLHGEYDERLEGFRQKFEEWHRHFYEFFAGVPDLFLANPRQIQKEISEYLASSLSDDQLSEAMRALKRHVTSDMGQSEEVVGKVLFTMVFGNVTNTGPAIMWALLFLLRDQAAMQELRKEIDAVLEQEEGWTSAKASGDPELRPSSVMKMVKLQSWVQDSIRIQSSMTPARTVAHDTALKLSSGHVFQLRKGDTLITCNQHLDNDLFSTPAMPRIDRFLAQSPAISAADGRPLKHALMAFGMGSSVCPGRHFAYLQASTILASLLIGYDIELVHPDLGMPPPDCSRPGQGCMPVDPRYEGSDHLRIRVSPRAFGSACDIGG